MEIEVVVGTYDCVIKGYSVDALEAETSGLRKKYQEKEHTGCVRAVASGGRYLATGGTDEVIKLYNIRKHTEVGTLLHHEGSITWLAFHEEQLLLSASEDGSICVWKCGGGWDLLHSLSGHKYAVTCLAVHPSGKLALSVGKDRTLRTWDLHAGKGVFTQRLKKAAELICWSTIADHYALSFNSLVVVHEVETGNPVATIDVGKHVNCMVYVKDTVLAVGSEHSHIQLFSTQSGSCVAKLEGHTNRVKALSLWPGGELLFSASSDGAIKAWRLTDPLPDSRCVCSVDSGSRVTCMTLVSPEALLKELRSSSHEKSAKPTETIGDVDSQSAAGESGCPANSEPSQPGKSKASKKKLMRDIQLKSKLSKKKFSKPKRLQHKTMNTSTKS